jgi:hypothetical protein
MRSPEPIPRTDAASAKEALFALQVEQHHHDEGYHREIARLSLHQRLNHMALHFAKYAGKIAATRDKEALAKVYIDVFVIGLSTANILNAELSELVDQDRLEHPGLIPLGLSLAAEMKHEVASYDSLVRETAIAAGQIAAACEKIDHLEDIPFRAEIKRGVGRLATIALAFVSSEGIDMAEAVRARLADVKRRLKLHGRM